MGINIWRLSRFQGLSDTLYLVSIVVLPVFPWSTLQKFVCNEYMYNCIDETGYEIIVPDFERGSVPSSLQYSIIWWIIGIEFMWNLKIPGVYYQGR